MSVKEDMVVQFNYTLRDEKGEVLETNEGHDPIAYLHGHDNMMLESRKPSKAKR